ncbi:hypothetical protein [Pantoea sp. SGAir0215]
MLSNKSNKELVEAGHQFAKALDAEMPLIEIAKLVSALSTRLDCAIVRGDELQQKLDAMAAESIPEGYVLVPQSMNVSADAMESICFHGGDGDGQFGEFTDVILWVGHIENDDGTKTYGLNITTAEYPEDGSANISEFAERIGSGTHDTADKEAK